MIKVIAIAIQAIAVAGGAFVGVTLSSGSLNPSHEPTDNGADKHGDDHGEKSDAKPKKEKEKKKKSKKDDKHGGGHDKEGGETTGFMKFSRQFVVPIVSRNNVAALVIMDINLELDPSATENAYSREPKVRDALLKTLLQLSNEGAFGGGLLEQENLDEIRARLLASAKTVLGEDVVGVLILNVARQDV